MLQTMLDTSGTGSYGLFYTLLVLHVAAGLTGFGSIGLAGTYAGRASQLGPAPDELDRAPDQLGPAPDEPGRAPDQTGPVPDERSAPPRGGTTTEELVRYFRRPAALWWALLAVPWLGLGALAAEPHGGGVAQEWDLGAFVLWAGAAVVAAVAVVPALRRIRSALVPPGGTAGPGTVGAGAGRPGIARPGGLDAPARAGLARAALVASRGAAVCDVLFFLALALMIWQP